MGFRNARARILDCLQEARIGHWPRRDSYRKNWLQAERISPADVRELLLRCNGTHYRASGHDFDKGTTVHEFTPDSGGVRWYIKVFFDEDLDLAVFMSVHPAGDWI